MNDFPEFMKHPSNKIAAQEQFSKDIEGYVFDGADGSQVAYWTNPVGGNSAEHTHGYDEYMVVVQGQYTVTTKIHHLIERALISMITFNYKSEENGLCSNI